MGHFNTFFNELYHLAKYFLSRLMIIFTFIIIFMDKKFHKK